jgi:hypothetical protein
MSQDNNKATTDFNYKKYAPMIVLGILVYGFMAILAYREKSEEEANAKLHAELQVVETGIRVRIASGDLDAASNLLETLVHPSRSATDIEKESTWGKYTYNEWWMKIRGELTEQLISSQTGNAKKHTPQGGSTAISKESPTEDGLPGSTESLASSSFPKEFLGMYVYQLENGSTRFYKVLNDSEKGVRIIFQDNVDGNVRIENYALKGFDASSRNIIMESVKSGAQIRLRFVPDSEGENGLAVVDEDGYRHTFVGR